MTKEQQLQKIKEMEQTLAELKADYEKPKKFEFEYKKDKSYMVFSTYTMNYSNKSNHAALEHGRYRKTKEAAEQALELQRQMMRLHALAEQLDGLKEFARSTYNYYISFDEVHRKYSLSYSYDIKIIGVPYMTKECATEICSMLNEVEVEL